MPILIDLENYNIDPNDFVEYDIDGEIFSTVLIGSFEHTFYIYCFNNEYTDIDMISSSNFLFSNDEIYFSQTCSSNEQLYVILSNSNGIYEESSLSNKQLILIELRTMSKFAVNLENRFYKIYKDDKYVPIYIASSDENFQTVLNQVKSEFPTLKPLQIKNHK